MTTPTQNTPDEYLTADDLAAMLPLSRNAFYQWRSESYGPKSFKLGRKRVVWKRSEVQAWIAAQEQATARGGQA